MPILIATSNPGKLRDFRAAAAVFGITIESLPGFDTLPSPVEDQPSFEGNAIKKAQHYSRLANGEIVLADDSGLAVDALNGAPGIHSARYAAMANSGAAPGNSPDLENNARLLREMENVPDARRTARFVCVLAAVRNAQTLAAFRGEVEGVILRAPRGRNGFGYDPLFYFPALDKAFAELSAEEKARVSHRGQAFRKFLDWMKNR